MGKCASKCTRGVISSSAWGVCQGVDLASPPANIRGSGTYEKLFRGYASCKVDLGKAIPSRPAFFLMFRTTYEVDENRMEKRNFFQDPDRGVKIFSQTFTPFSRCPELPLDSS